MKEEIFRISKKQPERAAVNLFQTLVKVYGRENELIQSCVFKAWDDLVPIKDVTVYKMLRGGELFVKINSSVAKSELILQKQSILVAIQSSLKGNKMLLDAGINPEGLVTSIILR